MFLRNAVCSTMIRVLYAGYFCFLFFFLKKTPSVVWHTEKQNFSRKRKKAQLAGMVGGFYYSTYYGRLAL